MNCSETHDMDKCDESNDPWGGVKFLVFVVVIVAVTVWNISKSY